MFRKIVAATFAALAASLAIGLSDASAARSEWKDGCVLTVYPPSFGQDSYSGYTAGKAMMKCNRRVYVHGLTARLQESRTLSFDTVWKEASAPGFWAPADTWMSVRYVERQWTKPYYNCYTAGYLKISGWVAYLRVNSEHGTSCWRRRLRNVERAGETRLSRLCGPISGRRCRRAGAS